MSFKGKTRKAAWAVIHFGKAARGVSAAYKKDKSSRAREKRIQEQIEIIEKSDFFDEEWYLRNHIELQSMDVDVRRKYVLGGCARAGGRTSPYFCGEEYYDLHWDVKNSHMNPLLHYEEHGKNEGREIYQARSLLTASFPDGAIECNRVFSVNPGKHNRIAVLSCYFGSGRIPETLTVLMKGLKEVVDNIVLIGDCKVFPEELDNLSGYVCYAAFIRHEQYDFGSYKRGLEYIRDNDLFSRTNAEELVFVNDSCYGPVYPFSETYEPMSKHFCDFWGYADKSLFGYKHLQSFHIVFKKNVINTTLLDSFLERVEGICDRGLIIVNCETQLTKFLQDNGMVYACIASEADSEGLNLFNHPVTFLKEYRVPLVKKKAFLRESKEDLDQALSIIRENAPELSGLIKVSQKKDDNIELITLEAHRKNLLNTAVNLKSNILDGKKLNVLFLITSVAMFPSKPLFEQMKKDNCFLPKIIVIPDYRKGSEIEGEMEKCYNEILDCGISEDDVYVVQTDSLGRWEEITGEADIVCYNLPYYQATCYRYDPFYSIGRDFLPIMVNYGFYRSLYDESIMALDAYRYLWKAFYECSYTLDEYHKCSLDGGKNGEVVGYIKMDNLANFSKRNSGRKTVFVALHHSIEGGANDTLSLARFVEYFDYFKSLPDRFPEIDFIYRPHPFLYDALKKVQKWDSNDLMSYIREMQHKPNVRWSGGSDYLQDFADSDACIQDCGSFLVEYFYTGNPCCYMLKEPDDIDKKFAPLGKDCLEQCYISYSTEDIDSFIADVVISEIDPKAEGRSKLAEKIMVNYPNAAEAAIRSIKDSIMNVDEAFKERN